MLALEYVNEHWPVIEALPAVARELLIAEVKKRFRTLEDMNPDGLLFRFAICKIHEEWHGGQALPAPAAKYILRFDPQRN